MSSGATNYLWSFGDSQSSTDVNPAITFTNAGTYTITLAAVGPGGTNIMARTNYVVVAPAPPVAEFTADTTNGIGPIAVSFTNLSAGATAYLWDFGDGNQGTNASPTNTYTNAGSYTVTLTAVGPSGTNSLARSNYIVVVPAAPVADFGADVTNGIASLAVNFTNLSAGASEFAWDFGDGNQSTNTSPSNTYTNAGSYTVTLIAVGPGGTNALVRTNYIVVAPPPPLPDFAANATNGLAPLPVIFTNLSTGATDFAWDFGDGNQSTNASPSNTYTNAGSYAVALIAIGPGGTNVIVRTNYILVAPLPPVADFVANTTNGLAPLTVNFTNLSAGASEFAWDFGDGNQSTNASPANTYTNAGSYAVTLTAVGPGGTNALVRTNYIVVVRPPPLVDFTANATNGIVPLTVNFTNLSTGATEFMWNFGDGNQSTNAAPVNVYTNPGSYTVTLEASGPGGTNVLVRTNYIVVAPAPPVADFVADTTNGIPPLTVNFTNSSTGATELTWDFGDGNQSTNTLPANVYTNAGSYTVSLTAVGPGGTNVLVRTNYIVVLPAPPVADFVADTTNGIAPLTVNFTNLSTGATEWTWNFGDGNQSANTSPANTYTNAGSYTVTLTAAGAGGTNSFARTNYIFVAAPTPDSDLLLIEPLLPTSGGFQFAVSNYDGTPITSNLVARIEIYSTTNLALALSNWVRLSNTIALTNGLLQVNDADGGSGVQRYYRALLQP